MRKRTIGIPACFRLSTLPVPVQKLRFLAGPDLRAGRSSVRESVRVGDRRSRSKSIFLTFPFSLRSFLIVRISSQRCKSWHRHSCLWISAFPPDRFATKDQGTRRSHYFRLSKSPRSCSKTSVFGSGRSDGISPATPPTPPDKRFSRIRRLNPAVIPQDLTISSVSHSQRSFSLFPHVPSLAGLSPATPEIHPGSGQRRRRVGAEVAAPSCCVELRARDFLFFIMGST